MPPANVELKDKSVLDISHESLMRVWERLGKWVNEESDSADIYTRICESAILYEKNMAGLWRDPDLQIALDWKNSTEPNETWANQYNSHFELAMRFIDSSIQDKHYRVAELNRRKNLTRIAVAIFLIALSSLTLWAFLERNKSEKNEKMALTEKQKAENQEAIANTQKKMAEENALKALTEKENADKAKLSAEEQRKIAVTNAIEADIQKLNAEKATLNANDARRAAELDKQIALKQRQLSDSLKTIAFDSEKNAYRLRILSIAQNLAIKSAQAKKGTYDDDIKPLMALQAFKFNKAYNGTPNDPEIFKALFSSLRFFQNKSDYIQNFHSDAVRSVCYSPDGKTIASAGNDGKLVICNAAQLQANTVNFPQQTVLIENIKFNNLGDKIVASADNNSLLIYNIAAPGQKPKTITGVHTEKITGAFWYNKQILTSCLDMKIRLIDENTSKVAKSFDIPYRPSSICVNAVKNLVVIGCENGTIYILDPTKDKEVREIKTFAGFRITSIDLSADANKIACSTSEGKLYIFSIANPDKVNSIIAHSSSITMVKFNPSQNLIATSSLDGTVKLWNVNSLDEPPVIFEEHDSWVWALAFNPDGSQLVSCGKDKTVRTYLIKSQQMENFISSKVSRNFTAQEWNTFIGSDIPYEKTLD